MPTRRSTCDGEAAILLMLHHFYSELVNVGSADCQLNGLVFLKSGRMFKPYAFDCVAFSIKPIYYHTSDVIKIKPPLFHVCSAHLTISDLDMSYAQSREVGHGCCFLTRRASLGEAQPDCISHRHGYLEPFPLLLHLG